MPTEGWPLEAQGNSRVHVTTQDRVGPWWRAGHVCLRADVNGGSAACVPARLRPNNLVAMTEKDQRLTLVRVVGRFDIVDDRDGLTTHARARRRRPEVDTSCHHADDKRPGQTGMSTGSKRSN